LKLDAFAGQILLMLLIGLAVPQANAAEEIYLGSVAMDAPEAMARRLVPLTRYLSAKTGYRVTFRASPNLGSAVYDVGSGFTQVAYLTPVAYVDAREKFHVVPLVAPIRDGSSQFHLAIAVHKDSPIRHVGDLRGKKFAFGDEKALLQRAVVVGAGIRLEDLGSYAFLKHYDTIAKAVLRRDFDAGIIKSELVADYRSQGLRSLYESPPLPAYLFAVNAQLPPAIVAKLKKAFLELKGNTPENRTILSSLDQTYDGFTNANDSDYDLVRKLIAPFRNGNPPH
jgi:phosphonate transport system substrate-binding protein